MTASPQPAAGRSILGILLLLAIIGFVIYSCSTDSDSSEDSDSSDEIAAEAMCEQFVTERLKAPATADFPGADSVVVTGDNQYEVTASVDSENGFGAQIRTDYVCVVHDNGGDRWTLVSLDLG